MDVLKFSLKGRTAFFKKPEVNTYLSFTYGNIHKVALIGLLGAIRGYDGYAAMDKEKDPYPAFYQKLKNLQCAIVPTNPNGVARKKVQQFNNSVGYASSESGGNLIVKEQWLEKPSWDIYILLDQEEAFQIAEDLLARRCVYIPYLGKNDHPADIEKVEILKDCKIAQDYQRLDSLYLKQKARYEALEEEEEDDDEEEIALFKYEENLPVALHPETQMYQSECMVYTNFPVNRYEGDVYKIQQRNLVFF